MSAVKSLAPKAVALLAAGALAATALAVCQQPAQSYAASSKGTVKSVRISNVTGNALSIKQGKTKTLKVKVVKAKGAKVKLSYKSSNTAVAKVSSKGVLSAIKKGSAVITVTAKSKNTKRCRIRVTVTKSYGSLANLTGSFAANSASLLLAGQSENSCYSPLSAYMALGMVGVGTSGQTQSQILSALGAQDAETLEANCRTLIDSLSMEPEPALSSSSNGNIIYSYSESPNDGGLYIANSIWSGKRFSFTDSYKSLTSQYFDAAAKSLDFSSPSAGDTISQWIAEHTNNLLKPSFSFDADTVAVLVNTVYFKDSWTSEFNAKSTKEDTFHTAGGDVTAKFMRQGETQSFAVNDDYSAASMGLRNGGKMTFYLPAEGKTASDLIDTPEKTQALLDTTFDKHGTVTWKLPKFTFDCTYQLNEMLGRLGIEDVFDDSITGDFASMLEPAAGETADPFVSAVQQGTHIGIDEEGVEAAAYTAVMCAATSCMPQDHLDFTLDRPFVYTITAKDGTLLFMGTVQDPTAK